MYTFTISVSSMKQIIAFELKKIFRNRLILFMLLLFGILNMYHIYSGYQEFTGLDRDSSAAMVRTFQVYEDVSGEWSNDTIRYVTAEYERAKAMVETGNYSTGPDQPDTHTGYVFLDMNTFEQIRDEMDKRYHYENTMTELTKKAEENASFYEEKGNLYLAERNRMIAETYRGRKVTAFYDTRGLNAYFKYDFSVLMILILMIPMLSPLFAHEHEIDMYGLLHLTQNASRLPLCKLAAGMIAVCAVSLLFFAEDFLSFRYLYHMSGLSQPVFTLDVFFYSPLNITIGAYIGLNAALKILSLLVLGGICMAVSAAAKNEMIPFGISFAVILLFLAADAFLSSSVLHIINPVTLFSDQHLFREFQTVAVFGIPCFSYNLPIGAAVLELLMLIAVTVIIGRSSVWQRRLR